MMEKHLTLSGPSVYVLNSPVLNQGEGTILAFIHVNQQRVNPGLAGFKI